MVTFNNATINMLSKNITDTPNYIISPFSFWNFNLFYIPQRTTKAFMIIVVFTYINKR